MTDALSEVELLPCPFCGGKAERIDIDDGENAGGSCISCTRCLASSNVEFERKENFVSNWNTRATKPVASDEVGGLINFLNEASRYFGKRDTGGEDRAHWSNVYNSEACRKAALLLQALADEVARRQEFQEELLDATQEAIERANSRALNQEERP